MASEASSPKARKAKKGGESLPAPPNTNTNTTNSTTNYTPTKAKGAEGEGAPPPPPEEREAYLGHFFYLRRTTKRNSKLAKMFQAALWVSTVLRFVWTWYAYTPEKAALSALGMVGLAVFHLLFLKMNDGPVEVEPLLLELLSSSGGRPVPPLDTRQVPRVPEEMTKLTCAEYNRRFLTTADERDMATMVGVWKQRVESYSKAMWHSGKPDLAWYNAYAYRTFRLMPVVVSLTAVLTFLPVLRIQSSLGPDLPVWVRLCGWGYAVTELFLTLGLWLFVCAITLEILLVVHLEATQLRRHMARILVGELKELEEIFEDHLKIRMGTLASWNHYSLTMLYAATLSFGVAVTCAFYLYTEGLILDQQHSAIPLPSPYLFPLLAVGLAWAVVIGSVAAMNMISELMVMYIPTVPSLSFNDKQELVRYYKSNKAYFLLLPMGIVVTPLMFLGWLLSLTSMGAISLLNYVYATAQTRRPL